MDREGFDKNMQIQRETARNSRETTSYMGADEVPINKIDASIATAFLGYESIKEDAKVLVIATDTEL